MRTRSPASGSSRLAALVPIVPIVAALVVMAGTGAWIGVSFAGAAPPSAAPAKLDCVAYQTEASYAGVGYDHLVHLTNNCDKPAVCSVSTNVNPEPASVALAPGEKQTLVTWRGSPAREFTADVSCQAR
jgi:hypothetical protein